MAQLKFGDFCRLCLNQTKELINIKTRDSDLVSYITKLQFINEALVDESGVLPNWLCEKCKNQLCFSYKFLKKCIKSQNVLMECLNQIKTTYFGETSQKLYITNIQNLHKSTTIDDPLDIKEEIPEIENNIPEITDISFPVKTVFGEEIDTNKSYEMEIKIESEEFSENLQEIPEISVKTDASDELLEEETNCAETNQTVEEIPEIFDKTNANDVYVKEEIDFEDPNETVYLIPPIDYRNDAFGNFVKEEIDIEESNETLDNIPDNVIKMEASVKEETEIEDPDEIIYEIPPIIIRNDAEESVKQETDCEESRKTYFIDDGFGPIYSEEIKESLLNTETENDDKTNFLFDKLPTEVEVQNTMPKIDQEGLPTSKNENNTLGTSPMVLHRTNPRQKLKVSDNKTSDLGFEVRKKRKKKYHNLIDLTLSTEVKVPNYTLESKNSLDSTSYNNELTLECENGEVKTFLHSGYGTKNNQNGAQKRYLNGLTKIEAERRESRKSAIRSCFACINSSKNSESNEFCEIHKNIYPCALCGKTFRFKRGLQNHIDEHLKNGDIKGHKKHSTESN